MSQPVITIKNVQVHNAQSRDSICFNATVYKDGKRWCTVSDDGWGGGSMYEPISQQQVIHDEIAAVEAKFGERTVELKGVKPFTMKIDMDYVIHELLMEWIHSKDLKSTLRTLAAYDPNTNDIITWKQKFTENLKKQLLTKFPSYIVLNDIPFDEAMSYYRKWMDR